MRPPRASILSSGRQEREVSCLADGDDHGVSRENRLGTLDELGREAARLVEDPGNLEELDPGHRSRLADQTLGTHAVEEANAFLFGLLHFISGGGHLAFRFERADGHFAGAEPDGAARHVERLDDREIPLEIHLLATARRRARDV